MNIYDTTHIYNQLTTGDIIWAKRYTSPEEKNNIPEGHEEGPYIVIGKDENGIKCLYITSAPPKKEFLYYRILVLNNSNYSLPKRSYIQIAKHSYISQDRFIRRLGHLNHEDTKMLFKKIDIAYRDSIFYDMDIDTPTIPLEKGDIISTGNKHYLIIDETSNKYLCIEMSEKNSDQSLPLIVDGTTYYLDLINIKSYSKLLEPIRQNCINNKTLLNILMIQKQKLNDIKRNSQISRGTLIVLNNNLYYIYGEINDKWLAFQVSQQEKDNTTPITIKHKKYFASFSKTIEILKNNKKIEMFASANEEEINKIKELKKSHAKEEQKTKKKKNQKIKTKPEIKVGTIIKIANTSSTYLHIVIDRTDTMITTIQLDKYLENKYRLDKFCIEQIEYYDQMENFNLLEVLRKIRNIANGYINKSKLETMIDELKDPKKSPTLTKKTKIT